VDSRLTLNAGGNDQVRLLRNGSNASFRDLTVTARANTIQTIDFDAGLGITAYSISGGSGAETLTNIQTTGMDFTFTLATGNLYVTNVSAQGEITLAASLLNVYLGAGAVTTSITTKNYVTTGTTTAGAVAILATLGSIYDSSGSDLTATTANVIVTGNKAGVSLMAPAGIIGGSGTGRIDISYQGTNASLFLNAGGNDQVKLLRNGSNASLETLAIEASSNTIQTIDFDSGLGLIAYSVTGSPNAQTLTNIQTTGLDFWFTLSVGNLNVTSVNTGSGRITLTASLLGINLGASAIVTANATASAVSLSATNGGSIKDTSGLDLTSTTANIQVTGDNAGVTISSWATGGTGGNIGGSGTGRIDIAFSGVNSDLTLSSAGTDQVRLLRANSRATLDTLSVTAKAFAVGIAQTIDFDSGLGLSVYDVTIQGNQINLNDIETTGLDFTFISGYGELNVTKINTGSGKITLTTDEQNINLGSGALTTAYDGATAVTLTALFESIFDSSNSNLTATTANIITTGDNAGVTLSAVTGVIGSSGTGRLDISYQGSHGDLTMTAGGNNQVRLLRNGSNAALDTLSVDTQPNTTQTIDFDSGLGITTYSVSGSIGQETLNQIQTNGMAFSFLLRTGNLVANNVNTGSGSMELTTNLIDIKGPLQGTSTLQLHAWSDPTSIGIGDSSVGGFKLSNAELDFIQNGFSGITIGGHDAYGAVDVRTYTFKDPITIKTETAGGTIAVNGALATGSASGETGSITLVAGSGVTLNAGGSITQNAESLTATSLTIGGGTFSGGSGNIVVAGDLTISSGTFTSTSGTLSLYGSFAHTGGTFSHNNGTVDLVSGDSHTLTVLPSTVFYNLSLDANPLVVYYKFDETSGTTVSDSSIFGNSAKSFSATISSDVAPTNFANVNSLSFDGTAGYVIKNPLTIFPSKAITVAFWIKSTDRFN